MGNKGTVAIYMRLSQEDGGRMEESNSIANQRELLRSYAAKHFTGCPLLEFKDDGYSGANMDRPGVSELLNKVRAGQVSCIIVKDFSRFSRDYIEIGSYLEQIFPFARVRFIAIEDRYDSAVCQGAGEGLGISFQNLMNDLYCKDISIKVKSALITKKENGIYANGSCAFGYCKDPKDRHKLLVVEEEAAIVKRIFEMALQGESSLGIARQLNAEGIKTPMEYRMGRGAAPAMPKGGKLAWDASTICRMLGNASYMGDFVYGKYETQTVSGKPKLKPRSEWKVCENHHPAIIGRDVFACVQKSRRKKSPGRGRRHPLVGKLVCGNCRRSLQMEHTKNPCFFCGNRYAEYGGRCSVRVNVQFLEEYLLFQLQERAAHGHSGMELQTNNSSKMAKQAADKFVEQIVVYGETDFRVEWKFPEQQPGGWGENASLQLWNASARDAKQ